METDKETKPITIDENSDDLYNEIQEEIDFDLARMKKNVEIVKQLRMIAAEMEVEIAALHHAELFQIIETLKSIGDETNQASQYDVTIAEMEAELRALSLTLKSTDDENDKGVSQFLGNNEV